MRPSLYGRELGFLWVSGLSRPNLRSLSLRPDDLLTILKMALSIGIRNSISLLSAIQATGLLTITLVGLSPTEHTSLFLDTLPDGRISQVRFQALVISSMSLPIRHEAQALVRIHPVCEWFADRFVPIPGYTVWCTRFYQAEPAPVVGTTKCPESLCLTLALPPSGRRVPSPPRTLLLVHRSYRLIRQSHRALPSFGL